MQRGRVLLCLSKGAANAYLPGGHVEFLEQAAGGLRREIEEELGLKVDIGRFMGAVEHSFIQKGKRHCEINLVFRMAIEGLDARRSPAAREDGIAFRWVSLRALEKARLEPHPLCRLVPQWLRANAGPARWGSTVP